MGNIRSVFVREDALRDRHSLSKGGDDTRDQFLRVINDKDLICSASVSLIVIPNPFEVREPLFYFTLDLFQEVQEFVPTNFIDCIHRVHLSGLRPESTCIIKGEVNRVNEAVLSELRYEPLGEEK